MRDVLLCDGIREPIGRYARALVTARAIRTGEVTMNNVDAVEFMMCIPCSTDVGVGQRIAIVIERG